MVSQEFAVQEMSGWSATGSPTVEASLRPIISEVVAGTGDLAVRCIVAQGLTPGQGEESAGDGSTNSDGVPIPDDGAGQFGGGDPPKGAVSSEGFYDPDDGSERLVEVDNLRKVNAVRAFLDKHAAGHRTEYAAIVAGNAVPWSAVAEKDRATATLNPEAIVGPSVAFDAAAMLYQAFAAEAPSRVMVNLINSSATPSRLLELRTSGSNQTLVCSFNICVGKLPELCLDPRAVARDPSIQDSLAKHISDGVLLGEITFQDMHVQPFGVNRRMRYSLYELPGDFTVALVRLKRPVERPVRRPRMSRVVPDDQGDDSSSVTLVGPEDHFLDVDEARDVVTLVHAVWGNTPRLPRDHPAAYRPRNTSA